MKLVESPQVESPHQTIQMNIGGETVEIDLGIAELIRVLNTIPGINTFTSCQGGGDAFFCGYVMLQRSGKRGTKGNLIRFLQTMAELMDAAWDRYGRHMARYWDRHGRHPEDAEFHFSIEMGNGYVMCWATQTYPAVLEAAKKTAQIMRAS
ncbi:MAG: hypothetical protein WCF30_17300 [Terracidiphilus sp.]